MTDHTCNLSPRQPRTREKTHTPELSWGSEGSPHQTSPRVQRPGFARGELHRLTGPPSCALGPQATVKGRVRAHAALRIGPHSGPIRRLGSQGSYPRPSQLPRVSTPTPNPCPPSPVPPSAPKTLPHRASPPEMDSCKRTRASDGGRHLRFGNDTNWRCDWRSGKRHFCLFCCSD